MGAHVIKERHKPLIVWGMCNEAYVSINWGLNLVRPVKCSHLNATFLNHVHNFPKLMKNCIKISSFSISFFQWDCSCISLWHNAKPLIHAQSPSFILNTPTKIHLNLFISPYYPLYSLLCFKIKWNSLSSNHGLKRRHWGAQNLH